MPTYLLERDDERAYVLDNLDRLVVKAVDGAGGYGMLIGPHATPGEREAFARACATTRAATSPRRRSGCRARPCWWATASRRRHVDLRPFILYGERPVVVPGGLTRVALRDGSLVVNSSQGGGTKDTWVLSR